MTYILLNMPVEVETRELGRNPFRIGEWLIEPSLNRISRGETTIQLELKWMDALVCLAERAGEMVTRFEIIDRVWATEFITDNTLTHTIAELRSALGDDARNPSFIETIHRRGYRLIASVEPAVSDEAGESKVARFPVPEGRPISDRDSSPYPGLAAFTEADAEFFFGREDEVARMWRKLTSRSLTAVIGPSGVGKSSFLRAGVIPARPAGWSVLLCQPGEAPFAALARALVPEFAGDIEATAQLVDIRDGDRAVAMVSRWRDRHSQALFIVDQFEELFTQNPPEAQAGFAGFLRKLVDDGDVHVLLSMRDDFLYKCHGHKPLRPVFDALMPLEQPDAESLRRAVVEPASRLSFAFETEDLPDEMIAEVEGERGGLPLLAFAMSRLWERRDRDQGLITHQAYIDIGGVGGALARHAEATIDLIGVNRLPIVRELFRNLVTAKGTRAVREWNELLSIFSDSHGESQPEEVLRHLVDARLLTSYEVREGDEEPARSVEIIHESLLANWPRLVRWQTQDQEGAQIRDELRQAARSWDEHGRHDDRLWTGTAFREFELWRERYPGGLTGIEQAFGDATVALAGRRRRRRRFAMAAVLLIAAAVATMTTTLWRRSVVQERRAEAQKLIALGQLQMEEFPTAALAYATKSLDLADSEGGRLLALEALWEGPTAFLVNDTPSLYARFSLDGNWLVQSHDFMSSVAVISRNGLQQVMDHPTESGKTRVDARFGGSEDLFLSIAYGNDTGRVALWSATEGRLLATAKQLEEHDSWGGFPVIDGDAEKPRALYALGKGDLVTLDAYYADGNHERLNEFRLSVPAGQGSDYCLDKASGDWLAVVEDGDVSIFMIGEEGLSDRRILGRHEGEFYGCLPDSLGRFFWTVGSSGEIRQWDPSGKLAPKDLILPPDIRPLEILRDGGTLFATLNTNQDFRGLSFWSFDETGFDLLRRFDDLQITTIGFDPVGTRFAMRGPSSDHRLWSLATPAAAEPIHLRRGPASYTHEPGFSPDGKWLATNDKSGLMMWPLERPYPVVIKYDWQPWSQGLAFGPDGRFLVTSAGNRVRVWPLDGPVPGDRRLVYETASSLSDVAVSPDGTTFAVGGDGEIGVWIGKEGEEPVELLGSEDLATAGTGSVSFSLDGQYVAARVGLYDPATAAFHIWEVDTGKEVAKLRLEEGQFLWGAQFISDGRFLTGTSNGVVAWDVETGKQEMLVGANVQYSVASADGRRLLVTERGEGDGLQIPSGSPQFLDLQSGEVTALTAHGLDVRTMALDQEGGVAVTADSRGDIRVGPVTGEEPHLLLGHEDMVLQVAVDPLGRWIASSSTDGTFRLWPMPDLSKPPLHTLPREDLIAKLKTLTNLRVVRDEDSSTGWKLEIGRFSGWETVPSW